MYNGMDEYVGLGIFTFPEEIHAIAHSVHPMATGSFIRYDCEQLLSPAEYKLALLMSYDVAAGYISPNWRAGAYATQVQRSSTSSLMNIYLKRYHQDNLNLGLCTRELVHSHH